MVSTHALKRQMVMIVFLPFNRTLRLQIMDRAYSSLQKFMYELGPDPRKVDTSGARPKNHPDVTSAAAFSQIIACCAALTS